ncbi:MAG: AraC family transcriptional regulator [Lachnospiraceae bacterium]|nr:AraC family transcriptional regulator [Lachnospiraceae bacterium]
MTKQDRLESFSDLILHASHIPVWVYNNEYQLEYTSYPDDDYMGFDTLFQSQVANILSSTEMSYSPTFAYSFLNLQWILDFETKNDELSKIYVIGPAFTNENSFNELKDRMDERGLSIKIKAIVSKQLNRMSIVPRTVLINYALQLHYLLFEEEMNISDIKILNNVETTDKYGNIKSNSHYGIWASEQEFIRLFTEGNPKYREAIYLSSSLSDGVKHNPKDSLRYCKNNFLVLLTLLSRAAINGGVSPDLSYDLCDYYAHTCELCSTMAEITHLIDEMQETYFEHVVKAKQNLGISKFIQNSCEYISTHINEKISITDLASKAGYSEYYFSRKFKNELGCSINEYVTHKKIERAKILLESTNLSILDISLELSFNSRSYFSDTFQKIVGMSPGEYRKKYTKV